MSEGDRYLAEQLAIHQEPGNMYRLRGSVIWKFMEVGYGYNSRLCARYKTVGTLANDGQVTVYDSHLQQAMWHGSEQFMKTSKPCYIDLNELPPAIANGLAEA